MPAMPALRLLMPKTDLLFDMATRCFSSCNMPDK